MKDRRAGTGFPFSIGCMSQSAVAVANPLDKKPQPPSPAQQADNPSSTTAATTQERGAREESSEDKAKAAVAAMAGVQRLLKGIKTFFAAYDGEEEEDEEDREIVIGFPTDVQHVGHIGWDGINKVGGMVGAFSLPSSLSLRQLEIAMDPGASTTTEVARVPAWATLQHASGKPRRCTNCSRVERAVPTRTKGTHRDCCLLASSLVFLKRAVDKSRISLHSKALHRKRLPLQWFMLRTHRRPHAIDPTSILASSCSLTDNYFFTRCILIVWPSRRSVVPLDKFCPYLSEKKPLLGLMRAYRPSYYTEASCFMSP